MLSAASEAPATRVAHPTSAGGPEGEAVVVEEAGCEVSETRRAAGDRESAADADSVLCNEGLFVSYVHEDR